MTICDRIYEAALIAVHKPAERYRGDTAYVHVSPWNKKAPIITHIGLEVETGGSHGGNCWGDESHGYSTGEMIDTEKIVLGLIKLGLIDENITVKQLFEIKAKFVELERSENEYYGNYAEYKFIGVPVKITEEGILELCLSP